MRSAIEGGLVPSGIERTVVFGEADSRFERGGGDKQLLVELRVAN